MKTVFDLRSKLSNLKPLHDTPFGRLHPYWARKPLNVLREIIRSLSQEGDIVADPFMGSGTTVFASLLENRSVVGWDINPLSTLIVQSTLDLSRNGKDHIEKIGEFLKEVEGVLFPWFSDKKNSLIIERKRFTVVGSFDYGNYKLMPTEVITKPINGDYQKNVSSVFLKAKRFSQASLLQRPINFERICLLENSRIAIPRGAKLSHYFLKENQASINLFLRRIEQYKCSDEIKNLLYFILSMSIPLLRLSDYKASSQWPYWRPKQHLTSRNPIFVFRRRYRELIFAHTWVAENIPSYEKVDDFDFYKRGKKTDLFLSINTKAFQKIDVTKLEGKLDLIVTDPPYGDHVPYLEYSSLWIKALNIPLNKKAFNLEIVKSDARSRKQHTSKYILKLTKALSVCGQLIKSKGFVVWFYQDSSLTNWVALLKTSKESDLRFRVVIPLSKQRRSMKTVTTPGNTFDGDLILIFQKEDGFCKIPNTSFDLIQVEKSCRDYLLKRKHLSFFERYSAVIQKGFEEGWLEPLSTKYKTIRDLLTNLEMSQ